MLLPGNKTDLVRLRQLNEGKLDRHDIWHEENGYNYKICVGKLQEKFVIERILLQDVIKEVRFI
jgi:hypothetical protein